MVSGCAEVGCGLVKLMAIWLAMARFHQLIQAELVKIQAFAHRIRMSVIEVKDASWASCALAALIYTDGVFPAQTQHQ